ncbi:hypothetical protein niasHT_029739 [Heterodera trifolii]|uniref:Uncharacterized protein n=1 Tax=Heterodera trifolii TaxID=157864 RepID=A0ABD2KRR6_9BILA
MANNSSSSSPLTPADKSCIDIETALFGSNYPVIHIQLFLLGVVLIAICSLIHKYNKNHIGIHKNLKLLLVNTIILYIINSLVWIVFFLRYRIQMFTYKHPCDFLSPVWMVPLFLGPPKLYSIAYPCFHFAIAFERIRSTFLAKRYERMGTKSTVIIIWIVWFLSFGYMMYVIWMAMADPTISANPQGIVTITTEANANVMLYGTIVSMVLVILTALCDWFIFIMNKRLHIFTRNSRTEYNLSLNYQINENTQAMLVIFPIDISFAIIYPIHNVLVILIRAYRSAFTKADFVSYCYWANTPLFLHSLVTVLLYIRFINRSSNITKRRNFVKRKLKEEGKTHFKFLEEQWNRKSGFSTD